MLHLLRAHAEELELYDDIYHWTPHTGLNVEVDYLLRRGQEMLAIEVKSQSRYHTAMLKGLRTLADLSGVVRRVLLYDGIRRFRTKDGIEIWPVEQFGTVLAEQNLWP